MTGAFGRPLSLVRPILFSLIGGPVEQAAFVKIFMTEPCDHIRFAEVVNHEVSTAGPVKGNLHADFTAIESASGEIVRDKEFRRCGLVNLADLSRQIH
ncbi:hypothetical protein [Roseateles sp. MS654]|uniref:hypothetical protein n=1 Tax=Roseateles sp. MS654 TaxID=3412685 RepID=UPI003C2BDCEB